MGETHAHVGGRTRAEAATGKDFKKILEDQMENPVKKQEVPANHLDPEVKAVVDKLKEGETSQIFPAQGVRIVVHLAKRTPEGAIPMERFENSIAAQIRRDKIKQMRSDYIERLRSNAQIEVDARQWKSIQKELGGQ